MKRFSTSLRRAIFIFWIFLVVSIWIVASIHPEYLDAKMIKYFLEQFGFFLLPVYFLLFLLRWFTLIPSMPLVIAGVLLFPWHPWFVFLISIVWILFSSMMIYYFSEAMGFDIYFRGHKSYKKIHTFLEKYGFSLVAFWSFAPVAPTDLICYVAGIMRMNIYKFILWVLLGEGIICTIIIYGGNELMENMW